MRKGRIINFKGNLYKIYDLDSKKIINDVILKGIFKNITLDNKSKFLKQKTFKNKIEKKIEKITPKVGDIVFYEKINDKFVISDILERFNDLERPKIANLNEVILVFSIVNPEFSFELFETFLLLLEVNDIPFQILITKIDLVEEKTLESFKEKLSYYQKIGYQINYVNNKKLKDLHKYHHIFDNKVIALAGQTGVGKSSFLNSLKPDLNLKTSEISKARGRGVHTTRHCELYPFFNGFLADTPGFSKLDFNLLYKDELKIYYPDFLKLSINCKYKSKCNHTNEPECQVIKNLNDGLILKERYDIYLKFFNKIKDQKRKY